MIEFLSYLMIYTVLTMKIKINTKDGDIITDVIVEGTDHYLVAYDQDYVWFRKDQCEIIPEEES